MLNHSIISFSLLIPLAAVITYYDVRYRRIPNAAALATLIAGLLTNALIGGWNGGARSLEGAAIGFGLMLLLRIFGAMGAGDVKLFAAVGAVIGSQQILTTFSVVVITGGALAVCLSLVNGTLRGTLQRVQLIFRNLLTGWRPPQFPTPPDKRQTIPYGVAITFGALISLAFFRQ